MPFIIWFLSGSLTLDALAILNHLQFPRLGLCFSFLQSLCRSWPLLGASSFLVFLSFPPMNSQANSLSSPTVQAPLVLESFPDHLFPDWDKGLSNVFSWQPGLKYFSDNTEMFLFICLSSWGYLESCECICSFLPHQCLTQWCLQNRNSEKIMVKWMKKKTKTKLLVGM